MRSLFIIPILFFSAISFSFAQERLNVIVKDSLTKELLIGATVSEKGTTNAAATDIQGSATINFSVPGSYSITVKELGYAEKTIDISVPAPGPVVILISPDNLELQEVMVSSTRTNSRIDDIPTRIEVLGIDDLNEENGVKPGNILSLLGDVAGIQLQQTSASSGNTLARVQGLDGRYTQILKDGMPLFGGVSGSLSIMQIPPLDLKQIEIIKGSASTLYGGDAIGGIINLVSKIPSEERELTLTINQSTLLETNVNGYYSKKFKKTGLSLFAQNSYQKQSDVDKDGLSDVPNVSSQVIHPKFIFYISPASTLTVNYTATLDKRTGGNMLYFSEPNDSLYHVKSSMVRNNADVSLVHTISDKSSTSIKISGSYLTQNLYTKDYIFKPAQFIYYSEFSYLHKAKKADWVGGINFNGDDFNNESVSLKNVSEYSYRTFGAFIQSSWRPVEKLTIETGFRGDYHSDYGFFPLPRISFLYKLNTFFTGRINGGYGYKIPSAVSYVDPESDLGFISAGNKLNAELSRSVNADINFNKLFFGKLGITINQSFFYTGIEKPVYDSSSVIDKIYLVNAGKDLQTKGVQTYARIRYEEYELYLGYVFTDIRKLYDQNTLLPVTPKHNFAATFFYEPGEKWRFGLESQYVMKQLDENYYPVRNYLLGAAMVQYNMSHLTFVLNCENLLDFRQNRYERIYDGTIDNPRFHKLWAPIDGRVINLSVKWSL